MGHLPSVQRSKSFIEAASIPCLKGETWGTRRFRLKLPFVRNVPRDCFVMIRCTQSLRRRNEPTPCSPSFPSDLPQLHRSDASPNERLDKLAFGENPSCSDNDSWHTAAIGPCAEIGARRCASIRISRGWE